MLQVKLSALNVYIRKEVSDKSVNLSTHHKRSKEPKQARIRNKIRAKDNEIENRETMEKVNETKNWLFAKFNKMEQTSSKI